MTNEKISKKYGIEPILKEMWVWDGDKADIERALVILKYTGYRKYRYLTSKGKGATIIAFINASETNPNSKEPKYGDVGYFWDDEESYYYGVCGNINTEHSFPFATIHKEFSHFSHDKQPWMK